MKSLVQAIFGYFLIYVALGSLLTLACFYVSGNIIAAAAFSFGIILVVVVFFAVAVFGAGLIIDA